MYYLRCLSVLLVLCQEEIWRLQQQMQTLFENGKIDFFRNVKACMKDKCEIRVHKFVVN